MDAIKEGIDDNGRKRPSRPEVYGSGKRFKIHQLHNLLPRHTLINGDFSGQTIPWKSQKCIVAGTMAKNWNSKIKISDIAISKCIRNQVQNIGPKAPIIRIYFRVKTNFSNFNWETLYHKIQPSLESLLKHQSNPASIMDQSMAISSKMSSDIFLQKTLAHIWKSFHKTMQTGLVCVNVSKNSLSFWKSLL